MMGLSVSRCKPCRQIAPVYSQLAEKFEGGFFAEVDVDELQELADEFGVKVLPTFKVLSRGREELESFNGTTALLSGGLERKLRK